MDRATVPKTTVHKNCELFLMKNKIRFADDFLISTPAGNLVCPENRNQFEFRILVPLGFDRGHDQRPLLFGKYICHLSFYAMWASLRGKGIRVNSRLHRRTLIRAAG